MNLARSSFRSWAGRSWLFLIALLVAAPLLFAPEAHAVANEEEDEEGQDEQSTIDTSGTLSSGFRFDGEVLVGYRLVDQDGFTPKFREDIDLEEGGRLLHGVITLLPAGDEPVGWFDRIRVRGAGLGGDPYETWGLEARKTGSYRLDVRGRSADYFNQFSGNLHSWDTSRSHTDVDLSINATDNLEVWGKFRRFEQTGTRITTRDISRNVFQLEEPLDQAANTWGVGARGRFGSTTIWLEQSFRNFDDNGGIGSRGLNTGLGSDEAFLTFLEQREVRSMDAPTSRGGFSTRFGDGAFRLSGDFLYSNQELDFSFSRLWEGGDFAQRPIESEHTVSGGVERDIRHGTLEALWRASDQLTFSVRYRRRGWEQDGDNSVRIVDELLQQGDVTTTTRQGVSTYDVTLDQVTVGGEITPSASLSLFAEVGVANREQNFLADGNEIDSETDETTYKLGARVRPSRAFDVTASYERGDVDDPFVRVAPTESNALKVKARFRPSGPWQIAGNLTFRDRFNEISRVQLQTVNFGGSVTYRGGAGRWLMLGYSRLDFDGSVPIVYRPFFAGSASAVADSQILSNVLTLAGEYRAGETPLTLFGRATHVTSDGQLPVVGFTDAFRLSNFREIEFTDWTLGLRYLFGDGLYAQASGRYVDYEETTDLFSDRDDYDAALFTVGFGLRF